MTAERAARATGGATFAEVRVSDAWTGRAGIRFGRVVAVLAVLVVLAALAVLGRAADAERGDASLSPASAEAVPKACGPASANPSATAAAQVLGLFTDIDATIARPRLHGVEFTLREKGRYPLARLRSRRLS